MLGSFLTRGLVLVFGYAYPAYECYKTVERNKPEIEQLLFWCQYWILVSVLTVCERVGDAFVSWVPMYSEAKLAFFIYLWYPKTKGTSYVYDSFFKPYVAKHENEIDRNLLELRTRAGDMAILYWQRAASYGQTRIFEVLHFVAAQSTLRPHPVQSQPPQGPSVAQGPAGSNSQPSQTVPVVDEEPPSPTSSISSSQDQKDLTEVAAPSNVPKLAPYKRTSSAPASVLPVKSVAPVLPAKPAAPSVTLAQSLSLPDEPATAKTKAAPPAVVEKPEPPPKETVMDETLRRTRGRLRKARSVPTGKETE